jgi:hypothetical protein
LLFWSFLVSTFLGASQGQSELWSADSCLDPDLTRLGKDYFG